MSTILTAAHTELFRRPAEQQFSSFEELRTAAAEQRERCREVECRERDVLFGETGDVYLGDHAVIPTHFSMGQLAAQARVPMSLLERLKPETRASVMNQTYPRDRKHKSGLVDGDSLGRVPESVEIGKAYPVLGFHTSADTAERGRIRLEGQG